MSNLGQTVFTCIAAHLIARIEDIEKFAETRLSFEEWCNWEAFAACTKNSSWIVQAKPRYMGHVAESKMLGDLLVSNAESKVLVEIGIAHDGTGSKWLNKFENDAIKLKSLTVAKVDTLHIIILASFGNHIDSSAVWQNWLGKISFWHIPTALSVSFGFRGCGQLLLKGWCEFCSS